LNFVLKCYEIGLFCIPSLPKLIEENDILKELNLMKELEIVRNRNKRVEIIIHKGAISHYQQFN